MRRTILSTILGILCFLFLSIARQAPAQPRDLAKNVAAPAQASEGTVYYCASSWDQRVVYFSAPFETDELARTAIQDAYSQFLKQKYSYAAGASSIICSISQTLATAASDKSDDEDSVKRATHSVVETGWTYRSAAAPVSAAPPARPASAAAGHAAPAPAHASAPAPTPHAPAPVNSVAASPAAHTAPPVAPAAPMTNAATTQAASVAPATNPASTPAAAPTSGRNWYQCRSWGKIKGIRDAVYVTPYIRTDAAASTINTAYYNYMYATFPDHYLSTLPGWHDYCQTVSGNADQQAFTLSTEEKQWAASNWEVIRIDWTDTPAEVAATNAAVPSATATAAATAPTASSHGQSGMPFISCSTSGGAGIDTYLTGVFQTTRPVTHLPSGGNLVDQSVLDRFYAYLTQKGYKFKPGSNYGCDVSPTEAAAKAAQHKRAYEGGACSTCGKTVETGWKDE